MAKVNGVNELNSENDIYFFLEDEVRSGFYIPAVMKQCFAAEIQVMEELRSVCDRYGIRFFADWGSLLGAVRHGGFIPWDDDLDLMMLREDYMALLDLYENHPEEFPEGFEVRSYRNRENYTEFHGVVVGSNRISFERKHLDKFHGFPYIAAVDIFVLDHKSIDAKRQAQMAKDALFVIAVADEIAAGKLADRASILTNIDKIKKSEFAGKIEVDISQSPDRIRAQLYAVAEEMFASFKDEGSGNLIQNIPWGLLHPESTIPKQYYEKSIDLPFEYTTIPVPLFYDTMLSRKYRNYLQIVKNVAGHDYPCFKGQEENLLKDADFELPQFRYDSGVFDKIKNQRNENKDNAWKTTLSQCLDLIEDNLSQVVSDLETEAKLQLLADTQQLIIDMGGFVEKITDRCKTFITTVERMCEVIFNLYNQISEGTEGDVLYEEILNCLAATKNEANKLLLLKEVVIFTFKPQGFKYLKDLYEKYSLEENTQVRVIPIPYYHKAYDGTVKNVVYSIDDYPENINLHSYEDYDLQLHHPDAIVTQFPYDEWNKVMAVDSAFYAANLAINTEKLIYIPWFTTDEFTKDDYCEYENTRYYVTMPGVVYSDEVRLKSPVLRQTYIDRLCQFAGEDTRSLWEEKIVLSDKSKVEVLTDNCVDINGDVINSAKKRLLYYIGLSSFIQDEALVIDKIRRNLQIFSEAEGLFVDVLLDSCVEDTLDEINQRLRTELGCILNDYANKLHFLDYIPTPSDAAEYYSAYYGERSRYIISFTKANKPVMIQNCNV